MPDNVRSGITKPRTKNLTKIFTYRWEFDTIILAYTLNITGSSNFHTSTHFVQITQKNLQSLTLAILKVKTYKIHTA